VKKRKIVSTLKKGALSKTEKRYIEDWIAEKDEIAMAELLNRSVAQVKRYKDEYLAGAPRLVTKRSEAEEFRRELHGQTMYKRLQEEFSKLELTYFESDYIDLRRQFTDLTPTESKQLFNLITLDIFMHRHNKDRVKITAETDKIEVDIKTEKDKPRPDQDKLDKWYERLQGLRSIANNQTREYNELLTKHQAILKDLKGTRDQRIKSINDRGKFMSVLQEMEIEDRRRYAGQLSGIMDLAVEKEMERLSTPITYMDGEIDIPILNEISVNNYPED
jgi:hypothetical protein